MTQTQMLFATLILTLFAGVPARASDGASVMQTLERRVFKPLRGQGFEPVSRELQSLVAQAQAQGLLDTPVRKDAQRDRTLVVHRFGFGDELTALMLKSMSDRSGHMAYVQLVATFATEVEAMGLRSKHYEILLSLESGSAELTVHTPSMGVRAGGEGDYFARVYSLQAGQGVPLSQLSFEVRPVRLELRLPEGSLLQNELDALGAPSDE